MAMDDYAFEARRTHQESTFNADAIAGDAAHREVRIVAAFPLADDSSLELLSTLVVPFFDPDKHYSSRQDGSGEC